MTPETPTPQSRSARLRILLPIAIVAAGLALFLALFWNHGHGHKRHGRSASAEGNGSPVGGSRDEGNSRVTGRGGSGGSPVGGGPSRSGSGSGNKGETWWYHEGKNRKGAPDDAWWSPGKKGDKAESGRESPVGGSRNEEARAESGTSRGESSDASEDQPAPERNKPSHVSSKNPGEVAGQKGGPDDFWWRN